MRGGHFRSPGPWLRRLVLGAAVGLLLAGTLPAPPEAATVPTVGEIAGKVQEACGRTRDLTAHFQQTATNRSLGLVQEASGTLRLERPGKMRWEYQKPEPRLFVSDGKTLWDYTPADKQVKAVDISQAFASRLPLAFLAGDCDLTREFRLGEVVNAATRGSTRLAVLDLKPKEPQAGIARMLLEVNLRDYTVERVTIFDAVGNTTVIALSQIKLNTGIPDSEFTFTPPAGVTVVKPLQP